MPRPFKIVTVKGQEKLDRNFKRLLRSVGDEETLNLLQESGQDLQADVRRRAPLGETGNLKRGVVAKRFLRQRPRRPATFVAFDYRIAPHAHLVEYGHGGPQPAPAHPFFRPAIRAFRRKFFDDMRKALWGKLKREIKE